MARGVGRADGRVSALVTLAAGAHVARPAEVCSFSMGVPQFGHGLPTAFASISRWYPPAWPNRSRSSYRPPASVTSLTVSTVSAYSPRSSLAERSARSRSGQARAEHDVLRDRVPQSRTNPSCVSSPLTLRLPSRRASAASAGSTANVNSGSSAGSRMPSRTCTRAPRRPRETHPSPHLRGRRERRAVVESEDEVVLLRRLSPATRGRGSVRPTRRAEARTRVEPEEQPLALGVGVHRSALP